MADFFQAIPQLPFADRFQIKSFGNNIPILKRHFVNSNIRTDFQFYRKNRNEHDKPFRIFENRSPRRSGFEKPVSSRNRMNIARVSLIHSDDILLICLSIITSFVLLLFIDKLNIIIQTKNFLTPQLIQESNP